MPTQSSPSPHPTPTNSPSPVIRSRRRRVHWQRVQPGDPHADRQRAQGPGRHRARLQIALAAAGCAPCVRAQGLAAARLPACDALLHPQGGRPGRRAWCRAVPAPTQRMPPPPPRPPAQAGSWRARSARHPTPTPASCGAQSSRGLGLLGACWGPAAGLAAWLGGSLHPSTAAAAPAHTHAPSSMRRLSAPPQGVPAAGAARPGAARAARDRPARAAALAARAAGPRRQRQRVRYRLWHLWLL